MDTGTVTVTVNNAVPVASDAGVCRLDGRLRRRASATAPSMREPSPETTWATRPSTVTATHGTKGDDQRQRQCGDLHAWRHVLQGHGHLHLHHHGLGSGHGGDRHRHGDGDDRRRLADPGRRHDHHDGRTRPRRRKALTFTAGNGSVAQHTLVVSTQAANGTCALSGTSLTYTPNAGYTGADSCVVTITDENGAGQSATGTFTITVNAAGGGGGGRWRPAARWQRCIRPLEPGAACQPAAPGPAPGFAAAGTGQSTLSTSKPASSPGESVMTTFKQRPGRSAIASAVALAAGIGFPALGQAQELSEIVVTARTCRGEAEGGAPGHHRLRLQRHREAGITSLGDVASLTPGLVVLQCLRREPAGARHPRHRAPGHLRRERHGRLRRRRLRLRPGRPQLQPARRGAHRGR